MFSMRKPASKFLSLFLVLAMVCSLFGAAFAAEEETATPMSFPMSMVRLLFSIPTTPTARIWTRRALPSAWPVWPS